MRPSKLNTIDSRGISRSSSNPSYSPKHNHHKNNLLRPNSGKIIKKNSFSKILPSTQLSPKGVIKHYMSNIDLKTPNIKSLKPSQSQSYIRKMGKQSMIDKPHVVIRKNQNINQLQSKLKTLQSQITSLKSNISNTNERIQKIRKSRTKSKQSKNSSVNLKTKKRSSQSVQSLPIKKKPSLPKFTQKNLKNQQPQGLSAYVTRMKPSQSATTVNTKIEDDQQQSKQIGPYYISHDIAGMKEHVSQSMTILNFMKKVSKPQNHQIQSITVTLPSHPKDLQNRKTLVFDLDQTLIHCTKIGQNSDVKLPIKFPDGGVVFAGINIRNYAREILTNLSKKFQIIVFTASHSCYANVILDWIDPKRTIIHHRYFRQNCYQTKQQMYIKDLRIFKNRNLQNIVLIDNAPYSYSFQLQNGIPIIPFYNSKQDWELKALEKFLLQQIYPANDVRLVLKKVFKLNRYGQFSDVQKLVEQLYIK